VLAATASVIGPHRAEGARKAVQALVDLFAPAGLRGGLDEAFGFGTIASGGVAQALLMTNRPDPKAQAMLEGLKARGAKSVFLRYLESLPGHPTADAVLAAITTTLAWGPLMRKRISRLTAENLPWWMRLFGALIGASVVAERHEEDRFCGISTADILAQRSLTEVAAVALLGREPEPADLFAFQTLVGLLLSNGPGSISAQGAKGAVSADGPETPSRVQINKALVGFLTHSGYAHGGNGYEGVSFLLERFRNVELSIRVTPTTVWICER
jgi:hypothetical protein